MRPVTVSLSLCLFAASGHAQSPGTHGVQSYLRARAVLDAAVHATGGLDALRSIKTIRRQMAGDWIGSGQHPRPYRAVAPTLTVPPSNGRNTIVGVIDYGGNRWLDEALESDFTGDSITRVNAVTGSAGFETLTYKQEKPFYRTFTAGDVRKFRRYPEGVLLMALGRPETLEWVGTAEEFARKQDVISFADSTGMRVQLYIDSETHLLTRSLTLREHAIAGDSYADIVYLDYRPVGALTLPFHYIDRAAGVPVEEMRASSIEINVPLADERFRPPTDFAAVEADPSEPAVQMLGPNLYMIRGPYNTVFAAFRDHVVVFESPVSSGYAEACRRLIRETVPGKPIRYVISTHFHYDHVAGLRPYIADGVPVITTPDAKAVIEQVAASRRTMYPDALSRNPRAPTIETVADRRVLDDGTNRVELYDFGPTGHIAQMLVAYFPNERVLFEADVWDPISHQLDIAGSDAVNMARRIEERGLRVEPGPRDTEDDGRPEPRAGGAREIHPPGLVMLNF